MRAYLLPAWGYSRFVSTAQDLGFGPADWLDAPPLEHPHCLIAFVHWQQPFAFPERAYVFGDSSGFSLRASAARSRHLDAINVLQWQAELCTVGCVLDVPPLHAGWQQTLDATLHHTRLALPRYEAMRADGHHFRWWGVLHGSNEAAVREYYRALASVYPFADAGEGWAIKPEPTVNIYSVARGLRALKGLGIKRAHFLAATNQKVIAVLLALGPEAGLELVTFDSTYAVKSGLNRGAFRPVEDGASFELTKEAPSSAEHHVREFLANQCPCTVCAFMRQRSQWLPKARREIEAGTFGGWWSGWFQLHNLRIQSECTEAQTRLAAKASDDLLRRMLSPKEQALVRRIFEEDGHEPPTR